MKNAVIKLSAISILLSSACLAEFQVGDGAFQLDASLIGGYDSNLQASVDNISDYYLSVRPVLRYRRVNSRFNTDGAVEYEVRRYLDHREFNSENVDGRFGWDMQRVAGHTTAAKLDLRYLETSDANLDVNEFVRTKTFAATTSGEVLLADRNLFGALFSYNDSQHNVGSNQTNSNAQLNYALLGMTAGSKLNFIYSHRQSLSTENTAGATTIDQKSDSISTALSRPIYDEFTGSLVYGYRWLDRSQQEASLGLPDDQGSFYGIDFAGRFLPKKYFPKTTGTFHLGYEKADTPGLNDHASERFVGQINFSWAARENTTVGLFAIRSQDLNISDNTVINDSVGLTLRQAVGSFIDTNFGLTYINAGYLNMNRTDDRYEARAGATYKINRVWSSAVSYRYLKSTSDAAASNYTKHVVSGTVTYAF